MASILDLPDECLIMIYKKLNRNDQKNIWSNVCKRFKHICFQYFPNSTELNDNLATKYGHLIGTDDFPLRTIKRLNLSKFECTKYFLNKLRDCHKEIEEAKLYYFTDEYLAELIPLPNLKKLNCVAFYNFRGRGLIELDSLTELHIHSSSFFDPKYLLQLTYFNPLRILVMPKYPDMFSNRYAFEMIENLKNVEQLGTKFHHCKSWQLVGTLPKLQKLEIWRFNSDQCETCLNDQNLYKRCEMQHRKFFFDELLRRNQLEELAISEGYVSMQHILKIAELTNLKRLIFYKTSIVNFSLVFKDLVNLEELHLHECDDIYAEDSLELIRCCKKLKVLFLGSVYGVTAYFLTEANDILSRRQPAPIETLQMIS
uniref:F-box protein ORE9 n=1 Tax=Zeugodacus cucurbitae TaxID=28588 RepID=A0A0A1XMK5_ZEUCU